MPAPTIPRTPIPKFTKRELDVANLCATAIWYGINYETGAIHTVSDANLMSKFAPYFYEYHQTKKKPNPDIFLADVRELILAYLGELLAWIFAKG
jgi:beta-phosphoglucomutase-like phosphatase (HAD superfamily)